MVKAYWRTDDTNSEYILNNIQLNEELIGKVTFQEDINDIILNMTRKGDKYNGCPIRIGTALLKKLVSADQEYKGIRMSWYHGNEMRITISRYQPMEYKKACEYINNMNK